MAAVPPASPARGAPPSGELHLIHFNDVYEIAARAAEPVGGAPRFAHLVARLTAAAEAQPTHAGGAGSGSSGGGAGSGSSGDGGGGVGGGRGALVLFSGDSLSPSLMSTITKGAHMVPVLNGLHVNAACLGNHDLDGGADVFESIAGGHAFPWLCSNVTERHTGRPLGGICKQFAVVEARGGWRVGLLGLVEHEWLATLATVDPDTVAFEAVEDAAARLVPLLRGVEGCHVVVALTHMRVPNDLRLAAAARALGVDLILGGHDHDYFAAGLAATAAGVSGGDGSSRGSGSSSSGIGAGSTSVPGAAAQPQHAAVEPSLPAAPHHGHGHGHGEGGGGPPPEPTAPLVKSGSDFRTLTRLRLSFAPLAPPPALPHVDSGGAPSTYIGASANPTPFPAAVVGGGPPSTLYVDATRYDVTSGEPEDAVMRDTVAGYAGVLAAKLDQVIGLTRVPLDSRFESIRTRETALGCFVTDIMRTSTGADIALLNSGTLRADALLPPGTLRLRDLVALLPMQDTTVTLRMRGARVLEALENSVRLWPAREGRFAQVSGVRFAFDPAAPPGSRVPLSSVRVLRRIDPHSPAARPAAVATAAAGKVGGGATASGGIAPPSGGSPARARGVPAPSGAGSSSSVSVGASGTPSADSSGAGSSAGSGSSATQLASALLSHVVIDESATPPVTPSTDPVTAPPPPPDTDGPPVTPGVAVDPLASPIRRLPDGMRHGYGTHCHEEDNDDDDDYVEVGGPPAVVVAEAGGKGREDTVAGGAKAGRALGSGVSAGSSTRAAASAGGSCLTLDTGSGSSGHGGGEHGTGDAAGDCDEDGHATAAPSARCTRPAASG